MLQNDLSAMTLEKGTILIVDDNELNCEILSIIFSVLIIAFLFLCFFYIHYLFY